MKDRLFDGVGGRGRRVTTISLLLGALIAGVGAWAFFSGSGQGLALATAATLDAPGNVSASATSGYTTVTVPWNATTLSTGLAVDGYYVTRTNVSSGVTSAACGTSAALLTASTSCTDTSVPDGTYTYRMTQQQIVTPNDTWIVNPTPNATVTLFACHPPGSAAHRIVIQGEYVGKT